MSSDDAPERALSKNNRLVLVGGLQRLRISHRYVEDCWYSCPKAEGGCCDDAQGDECNCGADEHNALVEKLIHFLEPGREIGQDRAATSADEPDDDSGRPK